MNNLQSMLSTHPQPASRNQEALQRCIQACVECAQTCNLCADACLAEEMVDQLRRCIRLNLDCADICAATGRVVARQTGTSGNFIQAQLEACAAICRECGAECASHAEKHEHCRVCAESCRMCEEACRQLL